MATQSKAAGKSWPEPDTKMIRALMHPVRAKCLAIIGQESRSPIELARELGIGVSGISYHIKVLRDLGLIQIERTRQRRGAVEHFYKPSRHVRGDSTTLYLDQKGWEELATLEAESEELVKDIHKKAAKRAERVKGDKRFGVALTRTAVEFQ